MRFIVLAILILSTVNVQAQGAPASAEAPGLDSETQPIFEHEDECGSPVVESMAWRVLDGTVIEVTDACTIILHTSRGKRVYVDLVALDTNEGQTSARELLSRLVQGQTVTVLVNPSTSGNKRVVGSVHVGTKDVSRELLQAGVARFKEPKPYSVSSYSACLYRIAEREAKEAGNGLWKEEL